MLCIFKTAIYLQTGAIMSLPMYKKIQQDLFHMIASGQLRKGDKVPSESELMEQYYVSAITAKNALNALADQGLIVRVRGKGSLLMPALILFPGQRRPLPYPLGPFSQVSRPRSIKTILCT